MKEAMKRRRRFFSDGGQVASGELIMVTIILIFLFIVGFLFYFSSSEAGFEREVSVASNREAVELVKRVSSLPILSCNDALSGCVDLSSVKAFNFALHNKEVQDYAFSLFGHAHLSLVILSGQSKETYELFDSPLPGANENRFYYPVVVLAEKPLFGYWNITQYWGGGS